MEEFTKEKYNALVQDIFRRFPSVQTSSFGDAYKPGLDRMVEFMSVLGNPERRFRSIHVAGTNGKGSVANMLASVLAGCGLKTGLYTSPHILDFRERMRIAGDGESQVYLVPEEYVYDFLTRWSEEFDRLQLSFFEITTALAFNWFADSGVDWAVIEVGLGGRLDSTNLIVPELSIVTSIGLDHCDLLGDTLAKIAGEKAGIFKPGVPALVGQYLYETAPVFIERAAEVGAELHFAENQENAALLMLDKVRLDAILGKMDLLGSYQRFNLRTSLCAVELLKKTHPEIPFTDNTVDDSLIHTASRMAFHGRWERISTNPDVICDIGHNPAALTNNFRELDRYLDEEVYSSLIIVYGVMADKALDDILPLFPERATLIFTTPSTARAMQASEIYRHYSEWCASRGCPVSRAYVCDGVRDAVTLAMKTASMYGGNPLVYIGGSTFVVSEAVPFFA